MELLHGLVEFAGDVGDGLRGVGFAEKGREHVADLARGDAAQESLQDEAVDHLLAALIARQEAGMKAFAGARYAQARQQTELGDQVAEVEAIAVVQPGEWSVFVIAQFEIAVALGQKGLLNDGFQLGTSHFRPILFKEILEFGEVQLKMAVAEDFQFSHQGVPPLGVGSPEKVRPLFLLKNQIYTQKFTPPAGPRCAFRCLASVNSRVLFAARRKGGPEWRRSAGDDFEGIRALELGAPRDSRQRQNPHASQDEACGTLSCFRAPIRSCPKLKRSPCHPPISI